jgi:hypothetical protein
MPKKSREEVQPDADLNPSEDVEQPTGEPTSVLSLSYAFKVRV